MIKKNNGDYKFDLIGLIKLIGLLGILMVFYFTTQSENENRDAIQDSRIQAIEYRVKILEIGYESIDLKLDKLIRRQDSLIIILSKGTMQP